MPRGRDECWQEVNRNLDEDSGKVSCLPFVATTNETLTVLIAPSSRHLQTLYD